MSDKTLSNSDMAENDTQNRGDKAVESTALFGLLADIRKAVGDPTGKLMQDELVERCRLLRECADYIADKSRPAWKSGGRGVAVAKASKAISWPNDKHLASGPDGSEPN